MVKTIQRLYWHISSNFDFPLAFYANFAPEQVQIRKDMPDPGRHNATMTQPAAPPNLAATSLAAPSPPSLLPLAGVAAALFTVLLWAAGLAITRFGVTGSLSLWDVIFLRLTPPALLLVPLLWRLGPGFQAGNPRRNRFVALMLLGAGLPFVCASTTGTLFAPAAHAGALMPGSMPLFTALLVWLVLRERPGRERLLGLGLILTGVVALGGYHLFAGSGGLWRGHGLFLLGGLLWATYTLVARQSGLSPWHAAAVVYCFSALAYLPLYLLVLQPTLLQAPPFEIAVQAVQSVLSGLISMYTYGYAVQRLGPGRAAAFGALVPALAALLAIPLLGEWPEPVTWGGILLIGLGVALASGALLRPSRI